MPFCFWAPPYRLRSTRQFCQVPNRFVIARHTFVDFGPPLDFYELFIARSAATGTSIERISVTPPADVCFAPAKTEVASAALSEPPAELLGSTNPCTIPEKELQRELKRCKNCLVFSGAKVVMQVQCGTQARLIRSDILDRDMFDASSQNAPVHFLDNEVIAKAGFGCWTFGIREAADTPYARQ